MYSSNDGGATWNQGPTPFTIVPGTLVADPTQPSTLYVGTYYQEGLRKSTDGGLTWSQPIKLQSGVYSLAIDPQKAATLYLGSYGAVFKSSDSGSTWTLASGAYFANQILNCLAIDPRNSNTLYAGTDQGLFRTIDGGASWHEFNVGLGEGNVSSLEIDKTGTMLHAAVGGAVFDYEFFAGALDVSVGSDSEAHLLFTGPDGHLVLRTVESTGSSKSVGPYGPYDGWSPTAVADGSDGLTRVLWADAYDGSAALWLVGRQGNQASYRLGPVRGWTALDVSAGAPGATHVLWIHTDGRTALWTVDNSGNVSHGPTLGPYAGWDAVAIADGSDGVTRLLWNKVDGSAGLSLVGSSGLLATYRYSGSSGWRAVDLAVGADGQSRILWTNADGRMKLWRIDGSGNVTASGPVYDAPAGFTAQRVSAGPDGHTQVLWTDVDGSALLWQMSADNVFQQSFAVGGN